MTAQHDTPEKGQDSTEVDWDGWPVSEELGELDDEELAIVVEEKKQELRETSDGVNRGLLNEDVALTDEEVEEFWEVVNHLEAVAGALVERVPEKHRFGQE